MPRIFVSYRREDTLSETGRVHDRLVTRFGGQNVFMDVDAIPLGVDFRVYLTEQVASCDVFLAIIGNRWLTVTGDSGSRRIDDPGDFVRIEVEAALSRDILVIPVLVGNAKVPPADWLPESLRELSYRNGTKVRPNPDFHKDMDRLIKGIETSRRAFRKPKKVNPRPAVLSKSNAAPDPPVKSQPHPEPVYHEQAKRRQKTNLSQSLSPPPNNPSDRPPLIRVRLVLGTVLGFIVFTTLLVGLIALLTQFMPDRARTESKRTFSPPPFVLPKPLDPANVKSDRELAEKRQKDQENPSTNQAPADVANSMTPKIVKGMDIRTNCIGMKLKGIETSAFDRGAADGDLAARANERPQRQIALLWDFALGVNEVTQGEYQTVMGTNPSAFSAQGTEKAKVAGMDTSRFPVENVSWLDAIRFCNKLSEKEGMAPCYTPTGETIKGGTGYRLPTEAEWEYACRAGSKTSFSFGPTLATTDANFAKSLGHPTEVGRYLGNAFGLFDMHGNVDEWCQDWYDDAFYAKGTMLAPENSETGTQRVIRGGNWSQAASGCRSACRDKYEPNGRCNTLGFRVARNGRLD